MTKQKFKKGDYVHIRPFDRIDREDIGDLTWTPGSCYAIPIDRINDAAIEYGELIVGSAFQYRDAWVYRLLRTDGSAFGYNWAQGMLEPVAVEPFEIPDADEFLAGLLA